jgi:butyrate kinase
MTNLIMKSINLRVGEEIVKEFKILAINPGSTSTKFAVFKNEGVIMEANIEHSYDKIKGYERIVDQYDFRKDIILEALEKRGINLEEIDAVSARGGLLKPIAGGTYLVNEQMLHDLKEGVSGEHACNLGGLIANEIASRYGVSAYIVDPVVVDELQPIAKISGHPEIERTSIFHALNQKAMGRKLANELESNYKDLDLIIAHLGGGISIGAHKEGRVVDVNNALDGEGPFSPERSGSLPTGSLVELCYLGKYNLAEVKKMVIGKGGLLAYCNTRDLRELEKMIIEGDKEAKKYYTAMAYQVAKEIGSAATVLKGNVDAIILTGGIAHSKQFTGLIQERIAFIAPVNIYPGENELKALVQGALRVLRGEEEVIIYKS